jgi:uncharacterized membrane protein YqaE (UPF0057 family)
MDIRKCLTRIMIPLVAVSVFAILLPFNVVYLNMKLIGKQHDRNILYKWWLTVLYI